MPLVQVSHLVKLFVRGRGLFQAGTIVRAVDDVSFSIEEGETLADLSARSLPDTFPRLLLQHAQERPAHPACREKDLGIWQTWTWGQVADEVRALACGLAAQGFRRGMHLAIIGDNRPRLYWSMLAAQALGGIPVPMYQDAPAAEFVFVLQDADGKTIELADLVDEGKLRVEVQCLSSAQFLGMARPDLFIRLPDKPFAVSYFKSLFSIGLMMVMVVVLGVMSGCFLKGPVATILTGFVVIVGRMAHGFLVSLVTGRVQYNKNLPLHGAGLLDSSYGMPTSRSNVPDASAVTSTPLASMPTAFSEASKTLAHGGASASRCTMTQTPGASLSCTRTCGQRSFHPACCINIARAAAYCSLSVLP
jgi:hypothetical protein